MVTLTLSELDIRSLAMLAKAKARSVKEHGDRPYWNRLADQLITSIPVTQLPGLYKDK